MEFVLEWQGEEYLVAVDGTEINLIAPGLETVTDELLDLIIEVIELIYEAEEATIH